MVAEVEGWVGQEGFVRDIQRLVVQLYANDGLLMYTWVERLQSAFNILTELFDCIGLIKNMSKMVSMALQPRHVIGGHSIEAYGLWMMGEEMKHREILRQ